MQTLDQLREFINKRVQALEASNSGGKGQKVEHASNQNGKTMKLQKNRSQASQNYKTTAENCPCCSEAHKIYACKKFAKMDIKDRRNLVYSSKLCFNCLCPGHVTKECKSKHTCKTCNNKHNTLLHADSASKGEVTGSLIAGQTRTFSVSGLIPTALIPIEDEASSITLCRTMIDSGSQLSLISEAAVQRMQLKRQKQSLTVNGIGNVSKTYNSGSVTLRLKPKSGPKVIIVNAFILPNLTQLLPNRSFDTSKMFHMKSIELADPNFNISSPIELILGSDIAEEIILDGKFTEDNGLHFRNTVFGWIVSGKQPNQANSIANTSLCINNTFDLKKFWELEDIPLASKHTDEEIACEKHFRDTTTLENNRFIVGMPFKANAQPLGNTFIQAKRRFLNLEKRLEANPSLREDYSNFIHEFINLKHLEVVPEEDLIKPEAELNFLPHHCVHKEDSTTTKLRVVFDGSAKSSNGNSLNGSLMVGPTVQQDLFSILVRFRVHKIALSGDIAKMYRQIGLDASAKNFHRILWRDSPDDSIKQYRMTRVTYGIASSAFHSTRSIVEVANRCEDEALGNSIKNDFYVDDYLSGADSIEEAHVKVAKLCDELKNYGFELRKWTSSHHEIIVSLPESLRESANDEKFMDENYRIKTLGLSWKPNLDVFNFHSNFSLDNNLTKRKLLSETAKLFDPVGWLGPIVIKIKIMLQKLWVQGLGWDDTLSTENRDECIEMIADLKHLAKLTLPRCIAPPLKEIERVQLHLFTDASEMAYAAVVYIRIIDTTGKVFTNLVASKTRVAPIKTVSLPRLELCGAHLGIKLLNKIQEILDLTALPKATTFGWTDSTIVLQWLAQLPRTWTCFVANRVSEIQQILPRDNWNHVKSSLNLADCASRGSSVNNLIQSQLWWHGPEWLAKPDDVWPQSPVPVTTKNQEEIDSEKKHNQSKVLAVTTCTSPWIDTSRYSSLLKLYRVIALVIVAFQKLRRSTATNCITRKTLCEAKLLVVQTHQQQYYPKELASLKSSKDLPHTSKLLSLSPFFDKDTGTLRVGGRVSQSSNDEQQKFPHLIHQDSHLAILVFQHFHEVTLHGGGQLTLNSSRAEYWIPRGKNVSNKVIKNCVKCSRFGSEAPVQIMADLPSQRLHAGSPFRNTGIDLAGPIMTKENSKSYIMVFVCFATKAIHIELVTDLSKKSCIMTLKRFIARRGLPEKLFSDNRTNFIRARNDLMKIKILFSKDSNEHSINHFVTQRGIDWVTIPPRAPHFGGLWEAAIKSMKRHLRRSVGLQILSFEELNTFIIEIESILNSRPITAMSNDPNDLRPLTPAQFLLGRPMNEMPQSYNNNSKANLQLNLRYRLLESLKSSFWKSWHRDYLVTLQKQKKWLLNGPEFRFDDLVLIAEDNQRPLQWKMARITELYSGNDNISRVAKVKTESGQIIRPIRKLRKLPVDPLNAPAADGDLPELTQSSK